MTDSPPPGSFDAGSDEPESTDPTGPYPTIEHQPQPVQQTGGYPAPDQTYAQGYPPQRRSAAQPQQQYEQYQLGYPEQPAYWQQGGHPPQPAYAQQSYAYSPQSGYAYGQPSSYAPTGQYAQPYPYAPAAGYAGASPHRRVFGFVATLLTLIGGGALVVSFTAVKWFSMNGTHVRFSGLRGSEVLKQPNPPALPYAYFNWLAWALLGIVVVSGLLGALPTPAHVTFRVLGALGGVAGAVVTYFAYYGLLGAASHYTLGYANSLQGAQVGVYLALGGFLVAAIGAATGPHRKKRG